MDSLPSAGIAIPSNTQLFPAEVHADIPRGRGDLHLARSGATTILRRRYAANPLKLLHPRNHGCGAWIYASTYGGGLVDGDAIDIRMQLDAGATGFFSSQSSTKVYRSHATSQRLHATLDRDALLVVAPDPLVSFAGAHYTQAQRFDLHADASLIVIDCLTAGRVAMGERWAFRHYEGKITITQNGAASLCDVVRLDPAEGHLPGRLKRFTALATVILCGPKLIKVGAELQSRIAAEGLGRKAELICVASPLKQSGTLVRIAGTSVENVLRKIHDCLNFVPELLGDNPWSRKW